MSFDNGSKGKLASWYVRRYILESGAEAAGAAFWKPLLMISRGGREEGWQGGRVRCRTTGQGQRGGCGGGVQAAEGAAGGGRRAPGVVRCRH